MTSFESVLDAILQEEPRYSREAYVFVQMAMDYYRTKHGDEGARHMTGKQLLQGVKELSLDQFGPMAPEVLNHWGLQSGEDVGEIVYIFIGHGVMNKSEEDKKEDFDHVIRFDQAMVKDYRW